MWKIGNVELDGKVILAPMAGFTSFGYRQFMEQFNPALTYTEMVSDMGLIYNNEETKEYLDFVKTKKPVSLQLFGSDPNNLSKGAEIALKMAPFVNIIDINMACPVPKVTKGGAGSALMKEPKRCGDIIRALKKITDKPITAKIRLGWDKNHINVFEVAHELENAGCSAIAIHCRTAKDLYLGVPDFNIIKGLKSELKIPIIVSGNIYTLDDAIKALEITSADAVMVARGGIGNPWLIKQIDHYYRTGERLPDATKEEQIKYCKELAKALIDEKGEEKAMRIYRSIAPKFISGYMNSKVYRNRLATDLVSYQSLVDILSDFQNNN